MYDIEHDAVFMMTMVTGKIQRRFIDGFTVSRYLVLDNNMVHISDKVSSHHTYSSQIDGRHGYYS